MVGSSLARSIAIMHDDLGIDADPESSGAYLTERAAELFRTALVWKPGARQLLHAVHDAGVPAALVTSTNRPSPRSPWTPSGASCSRPVCAATRSSVPSRIRSPISPPPRWSAPARSTCVAIEDSPLGIAAAEAAGCAVLAVPSEVAIEPAPTRSVRDSLTGVTLQHLGGDGPLAV